MSAHGKDQAEGKRKTQAGASKVEQDKHDKDVLLPTPAHAQKLSALVQENNAISRDEADAQAKRLLDKPKH